MKGLLRAITKDETGTLVSRLIPLENILHTKISIRVRDTDSIESKIGIEKNETTKAVEFDENELTICFTDGSEISIDAAITPYEFEVVGLKSIKTDSLVDLEEFLISEK